MARPPRRRQYDPTSPKFRGCKARAKRRGLANKEKSAFISKRRYLIVKRRERMSPRERLDLEKMLSYLPELKALRDFVDRLVMLFEEGQSEALAWGRHAALTSNRRFLAVPESAMEVLQAEKFAKMIAFLKSPACHRVRTNNHVERVNRVLFRLHRKRYSLPRFRGDRRAEATEASCC